MAKLVKQPKLAFTRQYSSKVRILHTEIGISPYKTNQNIETEPRYKGIAIWDTGATGSVITPKVASDLGLIPVGKKKVQGVTGISWANEFIVNIYLPNHVQIVGIPVVEAGNIIGNFDVLIGMDVISLGDLAVSNHDEKTKLSFQMPSTHNIDFVVEINRTVKTTQIKAKLKEDRAAYKKAHPKSKRKKKK